MRRRTSRGCVATSNPSTRASPEVGRSSVVSILIVVVLPAPFGPSRPKSSPCSIAKSTPRTASTTRALRRRTPPPERYVRVQAGCLDDRHAPYLGGTAVNGPRVRAAAAAGGSSR